MSRPTKSNVWDYFEPNKKDQDKANCKICNKSYSRKGRTTSSLKNHLKSMHSEEFSTFENIIGSKVIRSPYYSTIDGLKVDGPCNKLVLAEHVRNVEELRQRPELLNTSPRNFYLPISLL
ncbi:hypothetical protein ABMA28_012534 [Loxostege sticticalis]|uniref:BED-type domain-containing protein n=1 Tax=Loxostege sticticalis TaxID=481309 RepID=A0ABD0S461_LOXSC